MLKSELNCVTTCKPLGKDEDIELCKHGFDTFAFLLNATGFRNEKYTWKQFSEIINNHSIDIRSKCVAEAMTRVEDYPESLVIWKCDMSFDQRKPKLARKSKV